MFRNEPIFKILIFILIILITGISLYIYFTFFHNPPENLQSYFPKTTETLKYVGAFGYNYYINLATINNNEGNTEYIFTGKALENIESEVDSNSLRLRTRYVLQGNEVVEYFDLGDFSYSRFKKLTILKANSKTGDTWTEETELVNGTEVLVTSIVLDDSDGLTIKYSASIEQGLIYEEVRNYKEGLFITDIKYTSKDNEGQDFSYRIFRSN